MTAKDIAEKLSSDLLNIIQNQIPPNIKKFDVSLLLAGVCVGHAAASIHESYPALEKDDLKREITAMLLRSVEDVLNENLEKTK